MSLLKNFFFGGNGFSSRSFLQKTNQEILIYGILAILLSFFSHFSQLKIKCFFLFLHFQHNIYSLHIFCWILIKLLYWFLLLNYYFILLLDYILIGYWIGLFDDFFTSFTCFTPFKAIILTIFTIFTILAFHTIFTLHKRISTRESKELFISLTWSTNLKEYLMLNVKWHSLNFSAVLNDHLWSVFDFFLILPILIDHFGIYKHCLKVIKNHKRLL